MNSMISTSFSNYGYAMTAALPKAHSVVSAMPAAAKAMKPMGTWRTDGFGAAPGGPPLLTART